MMATLVEYYLPLKHAHVALAALSVSLYATRGAGVLAGARWPLHNALRATSVAIDTLLVAAGGTLWWMLALHPARDHWLFAKLALIVAYIVLGSFAIKRARTRRGKALAFAASLVCIGAAAAIVLVRRYGPLM